MYFSNDNMVLMYISSLDTAQDLQQRITGLSVEMTATAQLTVTYPSAAQASV